MFGQLCSIGTHLFRLQFCTSPKTTKLSFILKQNKIIQQQLPIINLLTGLLTEVRMRTRLCLPVSQPRPLEIRHRAGQSLNCKQPICEIKFNIRLLTRRNFPFLNPQNLPCQSKNSRKFPVPKRIFYVMCM